MVIHEAVTTAATRNLLTIDKGFDSKSVVIIYAKTDVNVWLNGYGTNNKVIITEFDNIDCVASYLEVKNETLECEGAYFHKESIIMNTTTVSDCCEIGNSSFIGSTEKNNLPPDNFITNVPSKKYNASNDKPSTPSPFPLQPIVEINHVTETKHPTKLSKPLSIYYHKLFIYKIMQPLINNCIKLLYELLRIYQPHASTKNLIYKPYFLYQLMKLYYYRLPLKWSIFNPLYQQNHVDRKPYDLLSQSLNIYSDRWNLINRYPFKSSMLYNLWRLYEIRNKYSYNFQQYLPIGLLKWYVRYPKYQTFLFNSLLSRYRLYYKLDKFMSYCYFASSYPLQWGILNLFQTRYKYKIKKHYDLLYDLWQKYNLFRHWNIALYTLFRRYSNYYTPLAKLMVEKLQIYHKYYQEIFMHYFQRKDSSSDWYISKTTMIPNFHPYQSLLKLIIEKYPNHVHEPPLKNNHGVYNSSKSYKVVYFYQYPNGTRVNMNPHLKYDINKNRPNLNNNYSPWSKSEFPIIETNIHYKPSITKTLVKNQLPKLKFDVKTHERRKKFYIGRQPYNFTGYIPDSSKYKFSKNYDSYVFKNFGKSTQNRFQYADDEPHKPIRRPNFQRLIRNSKRPNDDPPIYKQTTYSQWYRKHYKPFTYLLHTVYDSYSLMYNHANKYTFKNDKYYINFLIKTYTRHRKPLYYPKSTESLLNIIYAGSGSYKMYVILINTYYYLHSRISLNLYKPLIHF